MVQEFLSDEFLTDMEKQGAYLRVRIEALGPSCFGRTRRLMIRTEMIGGCKQAGGSRTAGADRRTGNAPAASPVITKEEMDAGGAIMKKTLS